MEETIEELKARRDKLDRKKDEMIYQLESIISRLDSKFDIEDLMTFIQMWNWYTSNSISKILPFNEYVPFGKIVNFELSHDTVSISIPEEVFTYQIQVKYPEGVKIYNLDGQNDFSFSHDLNHNGLFEFVAQIEI